ncbi:MAG TPA: molybdopterin-synthase adenylyltransferase MoeB [Polyangia bacterium]|jgi:molybdopterin/thiamine biosynthesis adenylyltransferase/rhodanese-related sulfurtransferase
MNFQQYLKNVKAGIREVSVDEVNGKRPAALIDVREVDEYNDGYITGATWIPRGKLELRIEDAVPNRDTEVVLYCAGGTRSALAAKALGELGYTRVSSLAGGYGAWKKAGLPTAKPFVFTQEQKSRYARHLMLPEVGEVGQAKLLQAKVLLLGAGGLGAPAALYLAAAGVGTLGLVDDDVVDESNLQRQVIHSTRTVGVPKVESAKQTIVALNPDVNVRTHQLRLSSENVLDVIKDYDLVVDGTDNFQTRYLLNDASLILKKPVVNASIFQFEGQVTVFKPFEGPCYRCLYPEPPPPGMAPSCNEAGVLGVLPGVIGVLQATEAVKLILGIGKSLVGRLLQYDALNMKFREFKLPRDPKCVVCSEPGKKIELIDYEAFCSIQR